MTTRISLEERGRQIGEKLEGGVVLPPAELLRNSGTRRTADKRRMLALLAERAAKSGKPPFKANVPD